MKTEQTHKIEWQEIELGNKSYFEITMGQSPSGTSYNSEGKGTPFFQGKAEFGKKYPSVEKWTTQPSKFAKIGDILMSVRAPVGSINMANIDCCIGRGLASIRCDRSVLKDFVYYFLRLNEVKIEKLGSGSTFKAINSKQLLNIKIPLPFSNGKPNLREQERIVKILKKAEKFKERGKNVNDLLDEYLKSVFNEMFGDVITNNKGWDKIIAEELFDMKLGKMLSAKNYTGKNLKPYLRNANVRWGYFDLSDVKEMDFNEEEFSKYRLKKGDILVCEGGEVGRTAIYNGEITNCCYQNALHRLRIIKPIIDRVYFMYFMKTAVQKGLIINSTSQVTIAHFTAEKFKRLKITVPPINLQQQFAKIVEQVEKMKENLKKTKGNSEELFNSLMQKAFRGEL